MNPSQFKIHSNPFFFCIGLTSIEAIGGEHCNSNVAILPFAWPLKMSMGGSNFPLAVIVMVAASVAHVVSAVDDQTWMVFVPFFPMSVLHGMNMEWAFGPY